MKNKRRIFLFLYYLTILFLTSISYSKSNFEVNAGLGKSSFSSSNSNSEASYFFGVSQNIYFGESDFLISFGGNFLQRASSKKGLVVFSRSTQPNTEIYKYDIKFYVNYVEIPLLLKYDIKIEEDLSLISYLGGSFSFAVHSRTEQNNKQFAGIADELEPDVYIEQENTQLENDYGLIFGLDVKFKKLSFGLSYYLGMNTITNIDNFSGLSENFYSYLFNLSYSF